MAHLMKNVLKTKQPVAYTTNLVIPFRGQRTTVALRTTSFC